MENIIDKDALLESLTSSEVSGFFKAYGRQGHPILFANKKFYDLIGYTEEDFFAQKECKLSSIIDPRDVKELHRQAADFIAGKCSQAIFEFRIIKGNGQRAWLRTECFAEKSKDEPTFFGICFDITASKNTELEYREELSVQRGGDRNMIAFGRINLTRNIIEAFGTRNEDFFRLEGETDQAYKTRALSFFQENFIPLQKGYFCSESLLDAYRKGKTEIVSEFGAIHKETGAHLWIHTEGKMLSRPEDGEIVAFVYNYDYTKQHNMDEIIKVCLKTDYEFVGIISAHTGQISLSARQHNFDFLPSEAESYDGLIQRCIDVGFLLLQNENQQQTLMLSAVKEALERETSYCCEFDTKSRSMGKIRRRLKFSYSDETRESIAVTCRNIEDLVRAERKKQQILEKALEEAEQANLTKTQFLAQMSHDIRTPMNAILGMAAIAMEETSMKEIRSCVENIQVSGKFLLNLINDILDISSIESGGMKLHPRICELEEFDAGVKANMLPLMESKGIHFMYRMECGITCIYIDSVRLNQIFFNLISNAVKYTRRGGTIEFKAVHLYDQGDVAWTRFTVSDNGMGMSEEFLEKAFDAFSRETDKTDQQWQGAGLGLTIVKHLVESMGGKITLRSKKGKGTQAIVDLPLKVVSRVAEKKNQEEALDYLEGKRVLLAEDNYLNIIVAKRLLENRNMQVEVAEDGVKAVSLFENSEEGYFDIVLMDIRMPEMDGLMAARKIRAMARRDAQTIPILAMTANAYDEDRQKTFEAGMNYHLEKPIDPREFYRTLNYFLSGKVEL